MVLWPTADPTHLAGRLDINIHPFAVLTAGSYRLGTPLLWVGALFGQVVPSAAVGVS